MTNELARSNRANRGRGVRARAAGVALALTMVMGLGLMATASLQAQTYKVLHTFAGGDDGASPFAGLIRDSAGNLYGTTCYGGASGLCAPGYGCGTVFKVDSTGTETVLHSFTGDDDGVGPYAGLVSDTAGNLDGVTSSGGNSPYHGYGVLFEVDAAGNETVLYSFQAGADGANPFGSLVLDSEGNMYGTTYYGGTYEAGTVFKVTPDGVKTILWNFDGQMGGTYPKAGLVRDSAGNLYGTTYEGGDPNCGPPYHCGTVFRLNENGEKVLHAFAGGADGKNPGLGNLVRDSAGNLYGTTEYGGSARNSGTVFSVDAAGNETVLYTFKGGMDGGAPLGGLVRDGLGNLYGSTTLGGAYGNGVVFEISPTGTETVLHSFTGKADGGTPYGTLMLDEAGNLYGTTFAGGSFNGVCGRNYPRAAEWSFRSHLDLKVQQLAGAELTEAWRLPVGLVVAH